jgi:hypothetical protein
MHRIAWQIIDHARAIKLRRRWEAMRLIRLLWPGTGSNLSVS